MIRSVIVGVGFLTSQFSLADEDLAQAQPQRPESEQSRFNTLVARTVGTTARPLIYDWRSQSCLLSIEAGPVIDLNTFESYHTGISCTIPRENTWISLGISRVWTLETDNSKILDRTPYRQVGRPSRYEIRSTFGLPVAEGIVTVMPSWLPAWDMVFSLQTSLHYLIYPESFSGLKGNFLDKVSKVFLSRSLSADEASAVQQSAPQSLLVDPSRLNILFGSSLHVFVQGGWFNRVQVEVGTPLLRAAPDSDGNQPASDISYWWEWSFGVGYAW